jgi:PAS domain S-box-containing protein
VQHLPAAVYATDAQGRIQLYNSAAVALWGRTPDLGHDRWCGSHRLYRPDGKLLSSEKSPMAVAAQEGRSIQAEEIIVERPDGARRHVLAYPHPTHDGMGTVVGSINMLVDITERKLAENLIQEQAALLEQTHDAIFVRDLRGGITYWNQGAERLYGFTEREALGRPGPDLLKTSHPIGMEQIEDILEGDGRWTGELIHTTRDGRQVTVESRLLLFRRADGRLLVLECHHDITARKQTEAALRESEERLRLATQSGKLGIWDWDIPADRVTWSDSLYAMHGLRPDQFSGRVEGFESLVHPDDRVRVAAAIQAALHEGMPYELEFRTIRPDGEVVWLFTTAAVFREAGRPTRMVGATFDITARRRAEGALRDSESLYRTLMEQAHDGIVVCDHDGRIAMANEVVCRLLGYSSAELLGRPVQDTYLESERELLAQRLAEVAQGKALHFERRMVRKDSSVVDVDVSVTRLPNGQAYAMIRDITTRKRAEAAAATRAERTRLLSETLAQLLSAKDPETIVRELFPKVAAHLHVDTYFNFMVDEPGQALRLDSCAGLPEDIARSFELLEFGQAICGTVAQRREGVIANDIQHSDDKQGALVRSLGIQTYACHPLMAGEYLLGTLSFASRTRSAFDDDEIEFLRIISQYTAVALDRLRTSKALAEHTRSLEIVNRVGGTLAAELDLNRLVQAVTDAGREVSGAEFGAFFYNVENDQGESYQLFTLSGATREAFAGFGMPRNTPVFGPTFRGEAPIRVPDILADPRYGTQAPHYGMPKGHLPVRSYLAVPVVSRSGEVLGGLFFGHSQPAVFTQEAEQVLVGIAAQAAVAIDNANLYAAVQKELAEHKRIEEALRASEEKFRTMADHIAQFAWMTDAAGSAVWYNRRWFDYTGTVPEEMQGWGWQSVLHPDHVERVMVRFRRCLDAGEFWEDTFPLRGRDGEYRWFLSRAVPIRDQEGKVLRWFGTNTDVTAQRETENALRRSEALYRAIGESIDYGIWVCDAEGRNTYASESFLRLIGLTQEQCAEFGWGRVLHPDDVERTIAAWRECVRAGTVWDCEHRFLGTDGRYHPVLARGVPVRDDGGRIVCWAGINLDISGLKQA